MTVLDGDPVFVAGDASAKEDDDDPGWERDRTPNWLLGAELSVTWPSAPCSPVSTSASFSTSIVPSGLYSRNCVLGLSHWQSRFFLPHCPHTGFSSSHLTRLCRHVRLVTRSQHPHHYNCHEAYPSDIPSAFGAIFAHVLFRCQREYLEIDLRYGVRRVERAACGRTAISGGPTVLNLSSSIRYAGDEVFSKFLTTWDSVRLTLPGAFRANHLPLRK